MAKATYFANASTIAGLDAALATIGSGAKLRIYSGTVPADADTALGAQVQLAELSMSATPFAGATDGTGKATATANAITGAAAGATGTASFFRILTSGGVAKVQGTCGTSDANCILPTTAIESGVTVNVTSLTVEQPELSTA